ncbi:MAG: Gfo/Idh/MocA family oxidoreductase [Proteobacteria bacterium]|nr:Gfo/Idh/MocA family oxidoreductase [Pseudomonadota bacterium]MBU2262105.1 Gfo/Idh/MocA family oxidoreductase [Pseudomonadota bacterium]
MKEIRIGVVGTGHLGRYHLQKYRKIPDCRIVGVADIVEEQARKAAEGCDCEIMTDCRGLLGKVDAVSIAVPTGAHYEVASVFLKAGVDVLLEKPIAATLAQADELIALAEAKGLIFQIGFVERFNPAVVALGTVMGKPLFIESHRLHPFFERGTDVDVILDLMVHDLDIILHFVNSPVNRVDAVGVSVLSDKVDIANARLTFASGCVANVTASRITGKIMQKIRFFGLEGYHAVDCRKRELVSLGRERDAQGNMTITENPVEVKPLDPLEEEIRAFVRAVAGRTSPPVSGTDGRNALELALRINEAIEKNQARNPLDLTAPAPAPLAPPLSDGPPAGDQVQP